MKLLPAHWFALLVVAVIAYYAGSNRWLAMITSKVGAG